MALIKENGIPNKNTKGNIGDLYLDKNTGIQYRCISSYNDSLNNSEYEWAEIMHHNSTSRYGVSTNETPKKETKEEQDVKINTLKQELKQELEVQKDDSSKNNYRNQYNKSYRPYNKPNKK